MKKLFFLYFLFVLFSLSKCFITYSTSLTQRFYSFPPTVSGSGSSWSGLTTWTDTGSSSSDFIGSGFANLQGPTQSVTVLNFGWNQPQGLSYLPPSSIVNSMTVEFNCQIWDSYASGNWIVQPIINGQLVGSNQTSSLLISTNAVVISVNGSTNSFWGLTLAEYTGLAFQSPNSGLTFMFLSYNPTITVQLNLIYQKVDFTFSIGINSTNPSTQVGVAGGNNIIIYVTGNIVSIGSTIQCRIGTLPGQVVQIGSPIDSPNWLKCQVPSQLAPGSYIVAISLDGGSTWTNENTVLYTYENCDSLCENGGSCINMVCQCKTGWTGSSCSNSDCSSLNNCNGNGVCTAPFTCTCDSGFMGIDCSQYTCGYCVEGTCSEPNLCTCPSGYSYDAPSQTCLPVCSSCGTTNTVCIAPNQCVCAPGWNGTNCDQKIAVSCSSLNNCSGNGWCFQDNICTCNEGWSGINCNTPLCTQRSNCNGKGKCVSPNNCSCNFGYKGDDCSLFDCSSLNNCTNHGNCIGPNQCNCAFGWIGNDCSECISINCTNLNNCNNHGICIEIEVCLCSNGYTGVDCSQFECFSLNNCSGNGTCIGPNQCKCNLGYSGIDCTQFDCSILNNCSNHGICVGPEKCDCLYGYTGLDCTQFNCSSLNNCNENGTCIEPNQCKCNFGYSGIDCTQFDCSNINNCSGNGNCIGPNQCICNSPNTDITCLSISLLKNSSSSSNIGLIVGVLIGAVFAISIIIIVVLIIFRKNKRKESEIPMDSPVELKNNEIPKDVFDLNFKLELQERLGKGNFGEVFKGKLGHFFVACKKLKNEEAIEIQNEVEILKKLKHSNIVIFIGLKEFNNETYLIMEYMNSNDLLSYIRINEKYLEEEKLFNIAGQIVCGMEYLETNKIIHNDLAARNVLCSIDNNKLICKISDFGLSRVIQDYYHKKEVTASNAPIPIKWTAPEVIFKNKVSSRSDVFSFGVVLFEVFSKGEEPWAGFSTEEVIEALRKKQRMKFREEFGPKGIIDIINECWKETPEERPTFKKLNSKFIAFGEAEGYELVHSGAEVQDHTYSRSEI